jgi:hypothetical protein
MEKFNTIALAYLNSKGDIVKWSSDTFGTPYHYPKKYNDSEENRTMLSNKVKDSPAFNTAVVRVLDNHNTDASALVQSSLAHSEKIFKENDIVSWKIVNLHLITDYKENLPKWEDVKDCIDNKKYD